MSGSCDVALGTLNKIFDKSFILTEEVAQNFLVNCGCSIELDEPDEEANSDPVPVGNEVEYKWQEGLSNVEESEDHPVS